MGVPKRLKHRASRVVRPVVVGILCLAIVQCSWDPPVGEPSPGLGEHGSREIDVLHEKELAVCAKRLVPAASERLLVAFDRDNASRARIDDETTVLSHILLVHDQQRVIVNDQYGAMACAAAVVREPGPPADVWELVALVQVGSGAVPSGWPYPPERTTCVYLNHVAPRPQALLRPTRDGDCPPRSPIREAGDVVEHVIVERPTLEAAHYPPMVRWDYDPESRMMYLGTTCGTGWCTIAPPNTQLSAGVAGGLQHLQVKGWYDEQYVASRVQSATGPDPLAPSRLVLRIMPTPDLGTWWRSASGPNDIPAQQLGRSRHVATVRILGPFQSGAEATLRQYTHRWGYGNHSIGPGTDFNVEMNLVADTQGNGRYVLPGVPVDQVPNPTAFQRKEDFPHVVEALRRLEHPTGPYLPLGIARWGWDERDESAWVRCGYGCCRVSDPF